VGKYIFNWSWIIIRSETKHETNIGHVIDRKW
jgi:hypothetical protein